MRTLNSLSRRRALPLAPVATALLLGGTTACGQLFGTRLDPLYEPVAASECPALIERALTDSTSTATLRTAATLRRGYPDPPIPADSGIPSSGAVTYEFTVDTAGRVDVPSIRLIEATHPAFAAAARSVIPVLRYEPARLRQSGCRMPTTVRWKARFDGAFVVSGE